MCKKLSLAMAFLGDPKLLILDEPLITLDAQARKKLAGHMVSSVEKNTIILISSHQKLEDDAIRITAQYNLANGQLIRE
jgi:ABC-2 type transport system ATP-binding protein